MDYAHSVSVDGVPATNEAVPENQGCPRRRRCALSPDIAVRESLDAFPCLSIQTVRHTRFAMRIEPGRHGEAGTKGPVYEFDCAAELHFTPSTV